MDLTYDKLIRNHEIYNGSDYINMGKDMSYDVLMPNLKYKDKKIYFISKNPIKLIINNNIEFKREEIFKNISLTGKLQCLSKNIQFKIIEEELDNGLKVNINIDHCGSIDRCEMQKIARVVEAFMLGIDLMDETETDENEYFIEEEHDEDDEYDEDEYEYEDINENIILDANLEDVNLESVNLDANLDKRSYDTI